MGEDNMVTTMALTERDLLKVQAAYPEYRIELRDGKVVVMSPSGSLSEVVAVNLLTSLNIFVRERRLGFCTGSGGGFHLPNGDIVAPDVTFTSRERMREAQPGFAHAVPDLAVEVKSPSDRISELEEKLAMLRELGAQATLLVDPESRTVLLNLVGEQRRTLQNGDVIELPDVLPGWSMPVEDLWPQSL
ncbi:MAG: Uma2 family endonuclease [Candidatus Eremiobacteraeota bacterium]|nr:Uma2 family endonuclease [Candidatus Eremiobacteraeota bacterium]